ncbi:hypothetical protein QAO71_17335 (plasmid) [Halopseudomonas sp. SMJS2]|uniref:hypothetical protein n=1 Tax=Halopseudomonas sp. SMJS2 TaxID=3041098 RepID=UPI002452D572|nr:hypothetical protein [Halopseudomonas sp. SMJS2]WGK63532.1 hypothetical protein QAO71_17335 [Halopseudomonas sp. SMJS2]
MQQLIHSQEAKAFLDHDLNDTSTKRPLMPVFLAKGSKLIMSSDEHGMQKSVATQVMLHVESAHTKILRMLRPFMFTQIDGVFEGYKGVSALAPDRAYSRYLVPSVELLADFDLLVCLLRKHPDKVSNPSAVLDEATRLLVKAYSRIHSTERLVTSGRLRAKHA